MNHSQPATISDPHARRSDPRSSHRTVASLAADAKLREKILGAAVEIEGRQYSWDDTDLTELLEARHGRRYQRNVIARERGLMERAGTFVCLGEIQRDDRATIHFRIARPNEQARLFGPEQRMRPQYRELTDWQLCEMHMEIVAAGESRCDADFTTEPCQIRSIYVKE